MGLQDRDNLTEPLSIVEKSSLAFQGRLFTKAAVPVEYGQGGEPNPHHARPHAKFNPLQKVMYQIVMLLIVPVQFGTGLLLWDVARFSSWVEALGGVRVVSTIHVLIFIFFASFILIHVYLGSLGHTASAHFKAMVTGYEEELEEAPPAAQAG